MIFYFLLMYCLHVLGLYQLVHQNSIATGNRAKINTPKPAKLQNPKKVWHLVAERAKEKTTQYFQRKSKTRYKIQAQ